MTDVKYRRQRTTAAKGAGNTSLGVSPPSARVRVAPIGFLTPTETELWDRITQGLPEDHFFAHELPILMQYVRVTARLDVLTSVLHMQDDTVVDPHTGSERLNPAFNVMKHLAGTQAAIARQLRLVIGATKVSGQKDRGEKATPPKPEAPPDPRAGLIFRPDGAKAPH